MTLFHGSILSGIVSVPNMEVALAAYRDQLGLRVVEDTLLDAELALSWDCPATVGRRMVSLQPASGAQCYIRLIEQPIPSDFMPTRSYGWASYEMSVQDVFGWQRKLTGGNFDIIGPPAEIPDIPYFVAMQLLGPGKEMLYLNEIRSDTPTNDLPRATSPIDRIFIVVLAAPDKMAATRWYRDRLALDEGDSFIIEYKMINKAFGLPKGTTWGLTMVQKGRMPIVEIDDYPTKTTVRVREAGSLAPGNALVTLAVSSLDSCRCEWIANPTTHLGVPYFGRRSATTIGPAGELIELVEIG